MKVSAIQMDMQFGNPDYNFEHAVKLVRQAALEKPDVITLPETWNVGFFPKENLEKLSDKDGVRIKKVFGELAKELNVNIVAGSIADLRDGNVYNTSYIFDRTGKDIASYDKVHLYPLFGEDQHFRKGQRLTTFELDGVRCGIVICYDIRFPELVRALALKKIDVLFVVAQWPPVRIHHWQLINRVRAIENQMFICCTNSVGLAEARDIRFGGHSAVIGPLGEVLIEGGTDEQILTAEMDLSAIADVRELLKIYNDRRPDMYVGLSD